MTDNKYDIIKRVNDKIFPNSKKKNIIFVYTPPKVGSTSLVTSLRIYLINYYDIIHLHDDIMLKYLTNESNTTVTVNDIIKYNANILKKRVFVINIFRPLIERKMSEYFEKLSPYHFNDSEDNIKKYSLEKLTNRFNSIFPYIGTGDHYFDSYQIPNKLLLKEFNNANKYTISVVGNITYLLLRLNDSPSWNKILTEIFCKNIMIVKDYETDKKPLGELYVQFKKSYQIPINYLDYIYNCKYLQFYFNEHERKSYISYWTNKIKSKIEFYPFSPSEYEFYVRIYLENQHYPDLQIIHYKDGGCVCDSCNIIRDRVKKKINEGTYNDDVIIHENSVTELNKEKINQLAKMMSIKKTEITNKKQYINHTISKIVYNKN